MQAAACLERCLRALALMTENCHMLRFRAHLAVLPAAARVVRSSRARAQKTTLARRVVLGCSLLVLFDWFL